MIKGLFCFVISVAILFGLFSFYWLTFDIGLWSKEARFLFVELAFFACVPAFGVGIQS